MFRLHLEIAAKDKQDFINQWNEFKTLSFSLHDNQQADSSAGVVVDCFELQRIATAHNLLPSDLDKFCDGRGFCKTYLKSNSRYIKPKNIVRIKQLESRLSDYLHEPVSLLVQNKKNP